MNGVCVGCRAQKLIAGLGGEKSRWTAAASRLGQEFVQLTGDVLLAAAQIAYLGAFTSTYRLTPFWGGGGGGGPYCGLCPELDCKHLASEAAAVVHNEVLGLLYSLAS